MGVRLFGRSHRVWRAAARVVTAVVVVGGVMATATPATADPPRYASLVDADLVAAVSTDPDMQEVRVQEFFAVYEQVDWPGTINCAGNEGQLLYGSYRSVVYWETTAPECFGIAPSRTIWHSWSGASAWHQMPGGGLADSMAHPSFYRENVATGDRRVAVVVSASLNVYCQNFIGSSRRWTGIWYLC